MPKETNNDDQPHERLGRPPKPDKAEWGQITCVLKHETIERIREGCGSKHFGEYLQSHLDRYPPPSREHYLWLTEHKQAWTHIPGRKGKTPVIYADGPLWLTPEERQWHQDEEKAKRRVAREERRKNAPAKPRKVIDWNALMHAIDKPKKRRKPALV